MPSPRWPRVSGNLESFYFAFGDTDAYVVLDLPSNQTAAAASIAVNTAGGAASEVVVLLDARGCRRCSQALGRLPPAWILTPVEREPGVDGVGRSCSAAGGDGDGLHRRGGVAGDVEAGDAGFGRSDRWRRCRCR